MTTPTFDVLVRFRMNVEGWRRGDEVRLSRTAEVQQMIDKALVEVVEDYTPSPPARSASRQAWADYLTANGVKVHPQATRRMLIDQWEGVETRG